MPVVSSLRVRICVGEVLRGVAFGILAMPSPATVSVAFEADPETVQVAFAAVIRGTLEDANNAAEAFRAAVARRGRRALGGAGFGLARPDLTPDRHRVKFTIPLNV